MPLSAGTILGTYEILGPLGAGGMGEVYRARDTDLQRDVAIKVLPQALARDPEQFARFDREARILAALNHPNIAMIHGLVESDGGRALVMELVPGETLRDRLKRGAMPLAEALKVARQIAAALETAHEKGVVHRDLKPGNVMITPTGLVKVLDFGLAVMTPPQHPGDPDNAATLTMSLTQFGTVMGTAAYMSPEQARGEKLDQRTDTWAFGVVLYEMLTGSRLFKGANVSEILAQVLTHEADLSKVSPQVTRLLRRCLERDRNKRLRDIGEVPFLLEDASSMAPGKETSFKWVLAAGLAAVLVVGVAALSWEFFGTPRPADRALVRLNVSFGPEAVQGPNLSAVISPDGTRLVFIARSPGGKPQLATRVLDQAQATLLAGTENAAAPFFSFDGEWVGFFAGGQMKKVSVHGGAVVTICDSAVALGASWGENQNIVFAPGIVNPLLQVSSAGGKPEAITKVAENGDATHRWPQVLPGGRDVLFTSHKIVTGFDDAQIEAVTLSTGKRKILLRGYFGRYVGVSGQPGYLVYVREGSVFAVGFDPDSLEIHGNPVPLIDDVAANSDSGNGQFDVSQATFLYRRGKGLARTWPILWLESSGKTEPLVRELGAYYTPKFSPDGTRLALTVDRGDKGREVEVYDLQRNTMTRLTFSGEVNLFPVWTPDGRFIAFETSTATGYGIGLVRSDGSGKTIRLLEHTGLMIPVSFHPDGTRLAYYETNPETGFDIWTVPFDGSDAEHPRAGKPEPFLNTTFAENNPAFSPDGRWVAYTSNESGRGEVYVRPFSGPGGKTRISVDGGNNAMWRGDGKDLYFRSPDSRIMVTGYTATKDSFVAGGPREWAPTLTGVTPFARDVTPAPDGKRFAVFPRREPPAEEAGTANVTFLLNFLDELRRKMISGK
ncbi:MAG: protein kinase [Acidobacteriota bacterium]